MAEVLFYHLVESTLETALPDLLERSLKRGWTVVVQTADAERLDALDAHLWTYSDDAFLPHGMAGAGAGADQPIWLTTGDDTPNGAQVRFLVHSATPPPGHAHERLVYMFDGLDNEAVAAARTRWKAEREACNGLTYWQQEEGRWVKKAEA